MEGQEMNQQRDLEGISALVTGASSGIGRAAAEELGRHGAEVVVHGRDAARGSAVVDTITAEGGKARFVAADLTDPNQLDDLVDQAGTVDVLVNNAGFSWFGPTGDLDVATFDRLFAANVRAPYFLVAALGPKMAVRGSGSIINIASMAGQIGLAGGAAYGATKATLASMTRSWAAEFSPSGVRVNAIAAGPVLTSGAVPERIEALGATTLLSRAAQPGEIGGHRLPRLPEGQLRHRRGHRRRRRAHRHMTRAARRQRRGIPAIVPSGWASTWSSLDPCELRHSRRCR
jgi:NAD(P)-dependent dehydrogenase (short-subunit alcohol dehydrogenase family)